MFDKDKEKEYFGQEFVDKIYSIFNAQSDLNFIFTWNYNTRWCRRNFEIWITMWLSRNVLYSWISNSKR